MNEYVPPPEISTNFLYHYKGEVVSVYDADTIRVNIDLGFDNWKMNEPLRIARIDAPEVRGEEREEGLVSRDVVRNLLIGEEVVIRTYKDKSGKYGRYVAEIEHNGQNVSDWLVENGFAEYKKY